MRTKQIFHEVQITMWCSSFVSSFIRRSFIRSSVRSSFVRSFVYSFVRLRSFVRSSVRSSFVRSFIRSFLRLFLRSSFVPSFVCSFVYLQICPTLGQVQTTWSTCLTLKKKNSRFFLDFIFVFCTFSRSGKWVCRFPYFFKNSRPWTNPAFCMTVRPSNISAGDLTGP